MCFVTDTFYLFKFISKVCLCMKTSCCVNDNIVKTF